MNQNTALYIHIPFCEKICPFCDFTKLKTNKNLFNKYLNALKLDLISYKEKNLKINTIYFGGGTPSTFPTILIKELVTYIKSNFKTPTHIEVSFEMNPEDVTYKYIKELKKIGINRISLGVQTFNDNECKLLGRIHTANTAEKAINIIKKEIENFNIDLMFSLPNSTINTLEYSINKTIKYEPKHISCYSLTIEPDTPFYKNKIEKSESLEDEKQYKHIINRLKEAGYNQYEISSFSKSNYKCKHNQTYWNFNNYIGIGTGSHSLYENKKYKKTDNINTYIKNPNANEITCTTTKDLIIENIIANLRQISGLKFKDYEKNYNLNFKIHFFKTLTLLTKNKLIKLNSTGIKLTKKGLYLLDDVCLSFL